jgi:hypothetical protein
MVMNYRGWLVVSITLVHVIFAEEAHLTGSVVDSSQAGIEGAAVKLMYGHLETVTDAQGGFSLTGNVTPVVFPGTLAPQRPVYRNHHLHFSVGEKSAQVDIGLWDNAGRLISAFFKGRLPPGNYQVPLFQKNEVPCGVYFVQAEIGGRTTVLQTVLTELGRAVGKPYSHTLTNALMKRNEVIDTLIIKKAGFRKLFIPLESYQGDIGVLTAARLTVSDFRISSEVPPWVEITDGYEEYNPSQLELLINGGAFEYTDAGMIEGINQKMINEQDTDTKYYEVYLMDFGTAAKASEMFDLKKNQISAPVPVGQYDDTVVSARRFLGGMRIYAHFSNFYLEFSLSGYMEEDMTLSTADRFLKHFDQMIN